MRQSFEMVGHFGAYLTVRVIVAVVQTLPVDAGVALCRGVAWLAGDVFRIRQGATDENLNLVFPDASPAARQALSSRMWNHLILMVCEIAWAQRRLHLANWSRHLTFRDNRAMLSILLADRPSVLVTGHFGNFEIAGYVTGLMGFETLAIARKLDNPFLDRWVKRFRGARGQRLIEKDGCAAEVDRHLRRGGILSLLADQHAGPKGCWVDFMGPPASCHKALAIFTMTADAPMAVTGTRRVDGEAMKFEAACTGIADPTDDPAGICDSVQTLTRWYNRRLAGAIAEAPEQYWWLHRRWRQPPPRVAKRFANRPTGRRVA